ncbi:MAG: 2,3-bisphosphoglycerate-independent phosphoglycerate mutase, partial [Bacteroidales bacterium]|nr:2,3-bisphosphoglycerate-independent phosphoglycerate mutase [Bacteroidales bacterium]
MDRKVLLMILDGWCEGKHDWTNAIYTQGAPYINSIRERYPVGHLQACGEYVGVPDVQMGKSEVGHL